jgi:predicted naringenin-chalcone synthase
MNLFDFQMIRPPFETPQEEGLAWLVEAHCKAEAGDGTFRETIREQIWKVGCKPDRIAKRGHVLPDFLHRDWEKMEVYRLHESPSGKNLSARSQYYSEEVEKIFARYYPEGSTPPDDLIHVTCTGYVSPSGAQKIASERNWGQATTVTHAYHMGCYGSIPALRMGRGFLWSDPEKIRADIVHTELCTLHLNPSLHKADQLVSQSLFADGFMKYSLTRSTKENHLRLLALREEIIPDSTWAMTWDVTNWGFQMSLAKEVAVLINRHLPRYLERLCGNQWQNALFAVHPGGPKILVYIQEQLGLSDAQMRYSFEILKEFGNMSSATLPHIWKRIVEDPAIPSHTPIVSLAFGPGLTIAGGLMEKG